MTTNQRKIAELKIGNSLIDPATNIRIVPNNTYYQKFDIIHNEELVDSIDLANLEQVDLDSFEIRVALDAEERFVLASYLSQFEPEYSFVCAPGSFLYACTKDMKLYPHPSNMGPISFCRNWDRLNWAHFLPRELYSLKELGINHLDHSGFLTTKNFQDENYTTSQESKYHDYKTFLNKM